MKPAHLIFVFGLAALGYGLYELDKPVITVVVGLFIALLAFGEINSPANAGKENDRL